MRVGIVRTVGSVCRCAESIAQGLASLGHDALIANSEEIEVQADDLVRQCDLIIDHTDTFKGRGFFRPLVRLLLESRGGRMIGSDARASFLADDKISAKARLSAAGIPTPPGIVVSSREWELPGWLEPPLVLILERGKAPIDALPHLLALNDNCRRSFQDPGMDTTHSFRGHALRLRRRRCGPQCILFGRPL